MTAIQTVKIEASASSPTLTRALEKAVECLFSHQYPDGFWSYTLEANETIGAGFIQVMHFLDEVDPEIQKGLIRRMLREQQPDGSWTLFYGGPGDLSTTIECYFALRLAGHSPLEEPLIRAKEFILRHGGLTKARAFTRIHLALFGIVPWSACPSMPAWFMLLPPRCGVSIYEFSSWARASIVPLLLLDSVRPVKPLPFDLSEIFIEPPGQRRFDFPRPARRLGLPSFFLALDRVLKLLDHLPWHPGKRAAVRKAERWTREHLARTEDIYPAMAYGILGLKALGYGNDDPTIRKAFGGLKGFQQRDNGTVHQQCCISPNWDTPWVGLALLEAGVDPKDPRILKAARYMIGKEIRNFRGDWQIKNPKGPAGGWSFEFQNDYFPDVDDAIEAIHFLRRVALPPQETEGPIARGLAWILSMQSRNGGWAAFDKNNTQSWVNKIPFSDHGACLDPPAPDITGRMIELLSFHGFTKEDNPVARALRLIERHQEDSGAWRGRWGVNYIYGTWCVLQGLAAISEGGWTRTGPGIRKAVRWLESIQNKDGGWGESCLSDTENRYVPLGQSVPSQTAWAVLGLMAAGQRASVPVRRGIDWLISHQREDGGWDEPFYTGTGFPGHFYIRYHGYRYYFPLLALGRYQQTGD